MENKESDMLRGDDMPAEDSVSESSYNLSIIEKDLLETFFPEKKVPEETKVEPESEAGNGISADTLSEDEACDSTADVAPSEDEAASLAPTEDDTADGEISGERESDGVTANTPTEDSAEDDEAEDMKDGAPDGISAESEPSAPTDGTEGENEAAYLTEDETIDGTDENGGNKQSLPYTEEEVPASDYANVNIPAREAKTERRIDSVFDIFELFIFSLVAVLLIMTFFFRHAVVDGSSMESTLINGEHLIISDFMYTPERGDIIVFEDPTIDIKGRLVKRVIAVGGDRVQITYSGDVYVNDTLLVEDYAVHDTPIYTPDNQVYYKVDITVPEGELFVMGDNRPVSADSRDPRIGTISEDAVLGRVLIRFYPFDKFGTVD